MSDLIERLQDVWDGKATFPTERLPEIIEQLKTVRGIEGLAKDGATVLISGPEEDIETWCVQTGLDGPEYEDTTLPLAVEAAVEAAAKKQ